MKTGRFKKVFYLVFALLQMLSCRQQDQTYPLVDLPKPGPDFYEAGLAESERQVRSNPNNPDAHYKRALYLQAMGQTDDALSSVRQAITLDPTPDYLITEAEILCGNQEYELALARISRAQILGGDYPDLWYLMAKLNYRAGNFNLALDEVSNAIAKYPGGINYFCVKGKIEWALNDTLRAFESFSKSVKHPKSTYESLEYLALISRARGDFQQAFTYLDENLQNHPHDREMLLEKASLLAETGQYDSALSILHNLRDRDTTDWVPLYESALIHFDKRWYDSTLYYTDKSLQLNQNHLPSMITQARVYDRRTYYGTAIRKYQEILAIDSTYVPAVEELAKLRGKIAYLRRIQKEREENAQVETISPTKPPIKD